LAFSHLSLQEVLGIDAGFIGLGQDLFTLALSSCSFAS